MKGSKMQRNAAAFSRKAQRADAHAAMLAAHADRRSAVAAWEAAYDLWAEKGIGPKPIHPDEVVGGVVGGFLRKDDDLLMAADELGIDLS